MPLVLYFERLRREFPPGRFSWSERGMQSLFAIRAKTDPEKALALARDLVVQKVESYVKWNEVAAMQENVVAARKLLNDKKPADALALLQKTTAPKYVLANQLRLLTAEAETAVGQGEKAYDQLADFVAAEAHEDLYNALLAQAPWRQDPRSGGSRRRVSSRIRAVHSGVARTLAGARRSASERRKTPDKALIGPIVARAAAASGWWLRARQESP